MEEVKKAQRQKAQSDRGRIQETVVSMKKYGMNGKNTFHVVVIPAEAGIQKIQNWIPISRLRVARYGGRRKVMGMTEKNGQ